MPEKIKFSRMENAPLIILPAFNVERFLPSLIEKLADYKNDCLFINDGSTDCTNTILQLSGFHFISNEKNMGVAFSINIGLKYAFIKGYDKVVLMDADGQHDPASLPEMFNALDIYDFVFTNRFSSSSMLSIPSCKLASNRLASSLYEEICGSFIPDVSCGFKGFTLTTGLISYLNQSSGYSIVYDIVNYAIISRGNIGIIEIPTIYYYNSLLFTRSLELSGLFNSISVLADRNKCSNKEIIHSYMKKVELKENFIINSLGIQYHLFYLPSYEGYIIQAPLDAIHKSILKEHV